MFPPPKPAGTISPKSLQLNHQPRVFRHAHSFPLTSSSSQSLGTCTTSSFGSNIAISHPSEYVPRHAPIPEDWMIQLPSSPTQVQAQAVCQDHRIQPEMSLLIPDYNGMEEGDEKLLRAASAMLAENDAALLAQPHLIDFTFPHSQSQSQSQSQLQSQSLYQQTRQPFRSWSSAPRRVISPFRIHPYAHAHAHAHAGRVKGHETSSPDSSDSFDTPLSVRQKRRREQLNSRKGLFGVDIDTNSMGRDGAVKESMGEDTFYGIRRGNDDDTPNTPTPIRFHNPTIRSTSKFSTLDDEEDEEEEEEEIEEIEEVGGTRKGRERDIWSAELIDMDMDIDINVGSKEVDDVGMGMGMGMGIERERSLGTVMIDSTLMKEKENESTPVSSGRSEFELDVKEEESDEYPSSPFQPTPLRSHQPVPQSPTPTRPTPLLAHSQEEEEEEEGFINDPFGERELGQGRGVEGEGGGRGRGGRYWKDGKGWRMVAEFRKYLDGERSGRDPRFDLKVFHWILTGCPEMQWSANGYGIEIKDVPAFYKNVLHKEAREKQESLGKVATKRDLPGKTSFERQLSGYGFKRVTTGKFMTIERPDLRRDNHDLLRRVQEVWQIIEEGSLMPKIKVERTSTTSNLRTKVRSLEQEVQQKDSKLKQMKKLITVLATDQVSPRKLHKMVSELGIDLPELTDPKSNSDINTTMDMSFELDKILTPLNTHKTRSNTLKSRTEVKLKAEPKVKVKAKGHGKGKGEGKGKITAKSKPKLQVKSTNTPIPTPTPSKSRPKSRGIINEEVTPLKSIEDDIVVPKLNKKGRGKKMA